MAENKALSVPGISVNNSPIGIVPNSFKHKLGKGEVKVRSESTGGGSVRSIHTEDAEDKIGKMSWEMYNTRETQELVADWKSNIGSNFISAQQPGNPPLSGSNMSMVNDPDFEGSADGVVTIEFEGDPLSNNF